MFAQGLIFQLQRTLFQGAADNIDQSRRVERFFDEIVGMGAHGLHRHGHITVAGNQDHRDGGIMAMDHIKQFESAHAAQAHVADNHRRRFFFQRGECLFGPRETAYPDIGELQGLYAGA